MMEHREYRKLHAEWYDLASSAQDHSREIDFWVRCIEASGEPVLELGSGTGRVLIPLLERGFDVSGIDTSVDMLDRCRAACIKKGLTPDLRVQSTLDLDLSRRFRLVILASGGLGLFTRDQDMHATFARVMQHLEPGGLFVYEFEHVPAENRDKNDGLWTGDWLKGPGDVVIAWRNRNRYESTTRVWTRLFVVDKYVKGRLVETEANERTGRFFTTEEAVRYAESAGFIDIRPARWLTEEPPGNDYQVVTVRCRKLRE